METTGNRISPPYCVFGAYKAARHGKLNIFHLNGKHSHPTIM